MTTSPYHARTNGMVERFNHTVKTMLRKMASEKPKNWDRYIPVFLFAYTEMSKSPRCCMVELHMEYAVIITPSLWKFQSGHLERISPVTFLSTVLDQLKVNRCVTDMYSNKGFESTKPQNNTKPQCCKIPNSCLCSLPLALPLASLRPILTWWGCCGLCF